MKNSNTESSAKEEKRAENTAPENPSSKQNDTSENVPRKTHRPAWWMDVIFMIIIFFCSQMAGVAICNSIDITPPQIGLSDSDVLSDEVASLQARFIACVSLFAMVISLLVLALYRRWRGWGKILSFRTPGWASPFRLLCAYILMWCFSIAIEPIAAMLPEIDSPLGRGGWLLVSAVLIAPLFEEIIFRGYIAGTLRKAYGAVAAWIGSSLIFGLAHGAPDSALSASFIGLILCFCYFRYRSLVMAIMLHAMNNLTACFLHSIGAAEATTRQVIGNDQIYWAVYALCLSVAIIAIARMWQVIKELESDKYLQ